MVSQVKYLGVIIGGFGRDIFRFERENLIAKAQKKAAQIKSYIKKSYDITMVGKAVWKLQMIPALLYGKQVVILNKKLIDKLQTIENGVYRYILGVGNMTPVAALRGEIGASRIETRIAETVLMFTTGVGKLLRVEGHIDSPF